MAKGQQYKVRGEAELVSSMAVSAGQTSVKQNKIDARTLGARLLLMHLPAASKPNSVVKKLQGCKRMCIFFASCRMMTAEFEKAEHSLHHMQ